MLYYITWRDLYGSDWPHHLRMFGTGCANVSKRTKQAMLYFSSGRELKNRAPEGTRIHNGIPRSSRPASIRRFWPVVLKRQRIWTSLSMICKDSAKRRPRSFFRQAWSRVRSCLKMKNRESQPWLRLFFCQNAEQTASVSEQGSKEQTDAPGRWFILAAQRTAACVSNLEAPKTNDESTPCIF